MEIITIKRKAVVLDDDERDKLVGCLKYCLHRYQQHSGSGIHSVVTNSFLEYAIEKFEEAE